MINCAMNNRTLKSSKFFHLFPTKLEIRAIFVTSNEITFWKPYINK